MMKHMMLCAAALLLSLTSCAVSTEVDTMQTSVTETEAPSDARIEVSTVGRASRTLFAMDTVMELTAYTDDETVLDLAAERIYALEELFSVTLEGSEIYELNRNGTATLSPDTSALLTTALELCESTNGALDITVYPIVSAWGFTTGEYRIPTDDELSTLLERVDHRQLTLNGDTVTAPNGVMTDLGSVAKGYTGDWVCALLREYGVTSALLNLGGNVQALGSKPDGSKWRIAIRSPESADEYIGIVSVSDAAVITSGGYERCFVGEDGRTYHHIIDPSTARPAENELSSVTMIGESGTLCDAMSTALFVMGRERGTEYLSTRDDLDVIFVTKSGDIYITEGLSDSFTPSDPEASITVIG